MRSTTYDPAGTVSDGIAAYERAVAGGRSADSPGRYRHLATEIRSAMHPGDTCVLAFAADLDRPGGDRGSAPAFVAVLDDRVLIAWRRGRVRRRGGAVVVPRSSINEVRARAGAVDPHHVLLTIAGDADVVIAARAGTQAVLDEALSRATAPTVAGRGSRTC